MREIEVDEIAWRIEVQPDDIPIRGNAIASGDDEFDREIEDGIIARLESGDVWAWASVRVVGTWNGLERDEWLGACSYADEADFTRDLYYEDMQHAIRDEIQSAVNTIVKGVTE